MPVISLFARLFYDFFKAISGDDVEKLITYATVIHCAEFMGSNIEDFGVLIYNRLRNFQSIPDVFYRMVVEEMNMEFNIFTNNNVYESAVLFFGILLVVMNIIWLLVFIGEKKPYHSLIAFTVLVLIVSVTVWSIQILKYERCFYERRPDNYDKCVVRLKKMSIIKTQYYEEYKRNLTIRELEQLMLKMDKDLSACQYYYDKYHSDSLTCGTHGIRWDDEKFQADSSTLWRKYY